MAFLEWRRFTFFDIQHNVDGGKIKECLQDTKITVSTCGNNHVVLCDVTGWAHLISRAWDITSFKAYELTVTHAQQMTHDPYLVTIGEEEAGINPMIKVWDWSHTDRHGNPICVKVTRAVPSHLRPTPATALAVNENKNLMAVGFQDGSVCLYRGDITRQRSSKMKTLADTGTSPITGLAFMGTDKLFVVSRSSTLVLSLGSERASALDAMGAAPHCAVLANNHVLTVAGDSAVYCYTTEGRGACYALEGEKVSLNWFRSYLVITTNESPSKSTASTSKTTPKSHHITILDIQNKFIAFSKTFDEIDAVLTEWGSFYILTKNKEMIYLEEKDLQSKLSFLFKKNLYDAAIWIARSQHYDMEGLMEIYKQYGDHLYGKGDFKGAIDQYIKTIGWLETSYVIRKYLESRHLEPLVLYLEELHKKGYATEDYTTLLLTYYVKIEQQDQHGKLKEFINSKEKSIDFDVDVAIKVVRQVSIDEAISLAANHKRHDLYLKMIIEDKKDYKKALDYLSELEFEDAEIFMQKYGHKMVQNYPDESTKFLIALCTDYKPRSTSLVDESTLSGGYRTSNYSIADNYIHMFLSHSQQLIQFVEALIDAKATYTKHQFNLEFDISKLVYNTLIEHYIHVWAKSEESEKLSYEDKIMKVLKNPESSYDADHALVICQMLNFKPAILFLYEENKLWRSLVRMLSSAGRHGAAVDVCRRRGGACPALWTELLWAHPPPHCLPDMQQGNEKLLSPILVIESLATSPTYTLGDVRKYLTSIIKGEDEVISRERELCDKYRAESGRMKASIRALEAEPVTFQNTRCSACSRQLELPTLHFMCRHSYHQHCFESYSESLGTCPACASVRPAPVAGADSLHARLNTHHDPYAVVSEYFGRGLFYKVQLVMDEEAQASPPAPPPPAPAPPALPAPAAPQTYGPGAEAKLRLQEGQSKQLYISNEKKQVVQKGSAVRPVPEGRMRFMEQQQYSSSLEANISKIEPRVHQSPLPSRREDKPSTSPKISNSIANKKAKNPFEEDDYDESKNPFAEEVSAPTNPFDEDDNYDKNLNPFS